MKIANYLQEVQLHLIQTHAKIFDWFHESEAVKNYRPADNGWTISEILEHIALTSQSLSTGRWKRIRLNLQKGNKDIETWDGQPIILNS